MSQQSQKSFQKAFDQAVTDDLFGVRRLYCFSLLFEDSGIQNSFSYRFLQISSFFASKIINDQGEIETFEWSPMYVLAPGNENDRVIFEHIRHAVGMLVSADLRKKITSFRLPLAHKGQEELIRISLGLSKKEKLTNAHLRRAMVSAWLCGLRQNVGSCFATAPAIMIQKEQPLQFFSDIQDILEKGMLERTFAGQRYLVPMSSSWGLGELRRPLLGATSSTIAVSPGLIASFIRAGVIDKELSISSQLNRCKEVVDKVLEDHDVTNYYELLRQALLAHYGVSAKDIDAQRRFVESQARMQMSIQVSNIYQASSPVADKVGRFEDAFEAATGAFLAINDQPLLKSWEFTLASLCDVKLEFSRWNLYVSLGLDPEERGGLGEFLKEWIQKKLNKCNEVIGRLQEEYDAYYSQLRTLEVQAQSARPEDVRKTRNELQAASYQCELILQKRDQAHELGQWYVHLMDELYGQFLGYFQNYFQEIYDAQMLDVEAGIFDDSPAGFRLVYKHGREDPTVWSSIQNEVEYIESLRDFFKAIEPQMIDTYQNEKKKKAIAALVTKLVQYIQRDDFIERSISRLAKRHQIKIKNPLKDVKKISKKPWAYTSGGTIEILLKTYYRQESELMKLEQNCQNAEEVFFFLCKVVSNLTPSVQQLLGRAPYKGLFMCSPTHAFVFYPGKKPFTILSKEIDPAAWVEKNMVAPMRKFHEEPLTQKMQIALLEQWIEFEKVRGPFSTKPIQETLAVEQFRHELIDKIKVMPARDTIAPVARVDRFLHLFLPCFSQELALKKSGQLLEKLPVTPDAKKQMFSFLQKEMDKEILCSKEILDLIKTAMITTHKKVVFTRDYHHLILQEARKLGLALPDPVVFADTNWACYYFGFVINVATLKMELWRLDSLGHEGLPMLEWKELLDGTNSLPWAVYTNPRQYLS